MSTFYFFKTSVDYEYFVLVFGSSALLVAAWHGNYSLRKMCKMFSPNIDGVFRFVNSKDAREWLDNIDTWKVLTKIHLSKSIQMIRQTDKQTNKQTDRHRDAPYYAM